MKGKVVTIDLMNSNISLNPKSIYSNLIQSTLNVSFNKHFHLAQITIMYSDYVDAK